VNSKQNDHFIDSEMGGILSGPRMPTSSLTHKFGHMEVIFEIFFVYPNNAVILTLEYYVNLSYFCRALTMLTCCSRVMILAVGARGPGF